MIIKDLATCGKKYQVIYADPPWPIGSIVLDRGKWVSPLKDKYPTMSLKQIKELPVQLVSNNNCSLFLWVTHTSLPWGLEVMFSWEFRYYCIITWDKGNGWSQHGFHKRTEMLLFGYRGRMNTNQKGKFIPTLISERKTIHSKKPNIIYNYLESNTPSPRIELFARQEREGWDCWGNEL